MQTLPDNVVAPHAWLRSIVMPVLDEAYNKAGATDEEVCRMHKLTVDTGMTLQVEHAPFPDIEAVSRDLYHLENVIASAVNSTVPTFLAP